jgi:hypothetical protein
MSAGSDSRKASSSDYLRQHPYLFSIEYPDASAPIRGRSILDLYRAFSVGGLIAFAGSGTSILLGYDSWKGFAEQFAIAALDNKPTQDPVPAHSLIGEYCDQLRESLEALLEQKHRSDWDPVAVLSLARELAQQWDFLRGSGAGEGATIKAKIEKKMRELFWIKRPLTATPKVVKWLDADPDAQRHWRAKDLVDRSGSDSALSAIDLKCGLSLLGSRALPVRPEDKRDDPLGRTDLLKAPRPIVDILACLRNDWRISRFVTLNYDLEIERALETYDFPFYSLTVAPPKPAPRVVPASVRARAGGTVKAAAAPVSEPLLWDDTAKRPGIVRSRLGERGRSIDLGPENAGELMLFAANYPSNLIQVIHLHGSVRDPTRMIVTDSDYNERYFSPGGWPAMLGDGQELMFRSNAVVFFGVGMNEEELLRPLRLLAQAPNRDNRPAFAFLESKGNALDTATALKLYQRYGVRTLFVGTQLKKDLDPEFGGFRKHPLVADLERFAPDLFRHNGKPRSDAYVDDKVIGVLPPLNDEIEVLRAIKTFAAALAGTPKSRLIHARSKQVTGAFAAFREAIGKTYPVLAAKKYRAAKAFLDALYDVRRVPRLRLTYGHCAIFHHVYRTLFSFAKADLKRARDAPQLFAAAIDSLEAAIRARALRDGLAFFAFKALEWRRRWNDFPGGGVGLKARAERAAGCFRRADFDTSRAVTPWHLCLAANQPQLGDTNALSERADVLEDEARGNQKLIIARWSSARGKGTVVGELAKDRDRKIDSGTRYRRWVISFANSCEFDSCFDMLADMDKWADKEGRRADCVLMQTDLIFSRNHGVPKLAEWHLVFKKIVESPNVRLLVFCEYPQTAAYFERLLAHWLASAEAVLLESHGARAYTPGTLKEPGPLSARQAFSPAERFYCWPGLDHIVEACQSRWLAAFLASILGTDVVARNDATFDVFREDLVGEIEHGLRLVQDPRQRVITVVDITLSHLERRVVRYGNEAQRLNKILSHAMLKHLFAFGTAVEERILACCPEIDEILRSYSVDKAAIAGHITRSVDWLIEHHLIMPVESRASNAASRRRLGLHSQVRRYLASKKGLPFALVQGRERTALTLLPILDEEAVPLDADDLEFLGRLFDTLIDANSDASADDVSGGAVGDAIERACCLQSERIRSAFGLMRGSLRIGIVLRATPTTEQGVGLSPLDEYFRRLLAVRRAVLRNAASQKGRNDDAVVWPLYEREWIWLLNELGVVRMVQGSVHDAMPLFELALRFEERRLKRHASNDYERRIYGEGNDFSLSKLRILLNLSIAAIERGDFERIERLIRRAKSDLGRKLGLVPVEMPATTPPDRSLFPARPALEEHREARILLQVCTLVEARVDYLCGAMGSVQNQLNAQKENVVALGLHGLTAWFFQILSDVQGAKGDLAQAAQSLRVARVEAEASGRPDLILAVMLSEAEYSRDPRSSDHPVRLRHQLTRLRKVELEAKRLGMRRVEVTTCLVRAKLYLSFGELRSAREDAMNALALATTQGLKIKRISGLIVMAALLGASDDEKQHNPRKEAGELVETARQEAERIGYKLAAMSAKELEIVLRGQGTIEGWASGTLAREVDMPGAGGSAG